MGTFFVTSGLGDKLEPGFGGLWEDLTSGVHKLEGLWERRKLRRQDSPWEARGDTCAPSQL